MTNNIAVDSLKFQSVALLALRMIVAVVFLFAAYAKLAFWSSPPAGTPAGMENLIRFLTVVEPLGAVALVVGFLTKWAASGFAIIMVGAILVLQFIMNVSFFTMPAAIGWDYDLLLLGSCVILMAFGAGKYSIDAIREKRR